MQVGHFASKDLHNELVLFAQTFVQLLHAFQGGAERDQSLTKDQIRRVATARDTDKYDLELDEHFAENRLTCIPGRKRNWSQPEPAILAAFIAFVFRTEGAYGWKIMTDQAERLVSFTYELYDIYLVKSYVGDYGDLNVISTCFSMRTRWTSFPRSWVRFAATLEESLCWALLRSAARRNKRDPPFPRARLMSPADLPLPLLRLVAYFVQASDYVAMVDTCRKWRFLQQLVHPFMDEPSMRLLLMLIREGRNVFLTGRGGTGKSTAMVRIRRLLEALGRGAKWMAPTGKAAIKVEDATTIHSVFMGALGRKTTVKELGLRSNYMATSKRPARFSRDQEAWENIQTLVIDEVSMMSDEVLRRLYLSAGMCTQGRKACKPMGGRQVILAGDMLQFPPVNAKFPFTTREWDQLNLHIVSLNYSWRHRENTRFDRMLLAFVSASPFAPTWTCCVPW